MLSSRGLRNLHLTESFFFILQEKRIECPPFTTQCSYDPQLLKYIGGVIACLIYNGFLIGAILYAVEKSQVLNKFLLFTALCIFGMAAMQFLCGGVWFLPYKLCHRIVS